MVILSFDKDHRCGVGVLSPDNVVDHGEEQDAAEDEARPVHRSRLGISSERPKSEEPQRQYKNHCRDVDIEGPPSEAPTSIR